MANASCGKKAFAAAVLAMAVSPLIASPAFGFSYVHSDELSTSQSTGAVPIVCTLDETASGGGVRTGVIMMPEGSMAEDCLKEAMISSESRDGLEAMGDYRASSLADYLADKQYACTVHQAASQEPGTQTTYDAAGTEGDSASLERWDNVVVTVE